jgi:hypothetical protein
MQWLRNLWMGTYRTGDASPQWAGGTTYDKYNRVQYANQVWESTAGNNSGNPPGTNTNWALVQNNFIGVSERLLYSGQTIVLTWALNKWFGTVFTQPPGTSSIYIQNNLVTGISPFRAAVTETQASVVYSNRSSDYVINQYSFTGQVNFTIYVPTAAYSLLGSSDAARQATVRAFVNNYLPAGLVYSVQAY